MSYIRTIKEINKDKYNELLILQNSNIKSLHEAIEEIAFSSPFPPNAYECTIPMSVYEENGKYYVSWHRWDSCD